MVTMAQMREFGQALGREFRPDRVVLFGSYANGAPTPDSGVDLLVVLPFHGKPVEKSVESRLRLRPRFPVDLLVRTPEKVRERLAMGDGLIREILDTGIVLYDARGS